MEVALEQARVNARRSRRRQMKKAGGATKATEDIKPGVWPFDEP